MSKNLKEIAKALDIWMDITDVDENDICICKVCKKPTSADCEHIKNLINNKK